MRVLNDGELMRATRIELEALLRLVSGELPALAADSNDLLNAQINLQKIRRALARLNPGLRL
ncbi:MAG: hypothetical protein QOH65_1212 [Methylobacteriaceae bacterium]|jgi:hypothetical protein|nr:hypothetical protein [Methylobacteriaceae bacterium]